MQSYSGALTFFRQESGDAQTRADVAVVGLPFDLAVSNRPGARFGPRAVREASAQLAWGECWPWGFDPFELLKFQDLGDVDFPYGDAAGFRATATSLFETLRQRGLRTVAIGGDHHVTAAALDGISRAIDRPLALLQFDAHTDTTEGPDIQHGTMFRHAIVRGSLQETAIVRVGTRTTFNPDEAFTITAVEMCSQSAAQIAEQIMQRLRGHAVYLTFDIDVLDPAYAPGTGTPVPGGPSTLKALEILRSIGAIWGANQNTEIVGCDLVEVSPPFDHAQVTSLAAAQVLHELCCLLCVAQGRTEAMCHSPRDCTAVS